MTMLVFKPALGLRDMSWCLSGQAGAQEEDWVSGIVEGSVPHTQASLHLASVLWKKSGHFSEF